jgi:hypothetical protein
LFHAARWLSFDTATGYTDTAFCFSRPHRMNALLASSPVTSQVLNVNLRDHRSLQQGIEEAQMLPHEDGT